MALIRKNLVVFNVNASATQRTIANGNGILLALAARPWPLTLSPATGLSTNSIIKMFAKDGSGVEILGTTESEGDEISMDLDRGYSFEHTDRAEILTAMEIVRFLDASSGSGALGVFTGGLTLTFTGDAVNRHNVELQIEVLEFD